MDHNIYAVNIPDAKLMAKGAWDLSVYITDLEIQKSITVTVSVAVFCHIGFFDFVSTAVERDCESRKVFLTSTAFYGLILELAGEGDFITGWRLRNY